MRRIVQLAGAGLVRSAWQWPLWLTVAALAYSSISAILTRTGGAASVPLDDAYIHFQFARAFANLTPFSYTEGSAPVAGATSLLWPALLAPAFWLGVEGTGVIWWAWFLGFLCLGLLARETFAISRQLLSPLVALGASLMVLCFGGLTWLAASGMEAVPFAWLWLRTFRRIADWYEAGACPIGASRPGKELLVLAAATPLMRPEGALASLCAGLALAMWSRGRQRYWAIAAVLGACLPQLIMWLGTGSTSSTTSLVKWLPNNPYLDTPQIVSRISGNLALLYSTLLNGELWSATVVPSGGAFLAVLALPALAVQAYRRQKYVRGAAVLIAALGMWLPATYDTFLWNRLRYLWPFAAAWFVALGAVCDLTADVVERCKRQLAELRTLFAGVLAGAFAAKLPFAIADVADSAHAIQEQQVALGRWARDHLAKHAIIGVNDTGAIAYFSDRRTFDVVGLTTRGEAKYWAAGAGSRFEHYERLPRQALPTHFIVYPEWFALDPLLGRYLTQRHVEASILGGSTMVAHEADYSALGKAARPASERQRGLALVDELDVADLESERAHAYHLIDAQQTDNRVFVQGDWVDGGRANRRSERFRLRVEPHGVFVVRASAETVTTLLVRIANRSVGKLAIPGAWAEQQLTIPAWVDAGIQDFDIDVDGREVAVLHYWSYAPPSQRQVTER